jgi:hypothetical protein
MHDGAGTKPVHPFAAELALICPVMLLVSPIVWSHYYYWMFFPLACLWHPRGSRWGARGVFSVWIVAALLIGFPAARAIGVNLWATVVVCGALLGQAWASGRAVPRAEAVRKFGDIESGGAAAAA